MLKKHIPLKQKVLKTLGNGSNITNLSLDDISSLAKSLGNKLDSEEIEKAFKADSINDIEQFSIFSEVVKK